MKVIRRIAQILNKFKGYGILIEGHANSEGKMGGYGAAAIAKEEAGELLPLSTGRAELVKKLLSDNGVDSKRLSTKGMGSSEPVVDFKDSQNRWKNRRVEFILIKSQPTDTTQ
jgi:outer membrane protein OmpA-like peptidoglycan-associated protein